MKVELQRYASLFVKYFPNDIHFKNKLGRAYLVNENYKAARQELEKVLNLEPSNHEAVVSAIFGGHPRVFQTITLPLFRAF